MNTISITKIWDNKKYDTIIDVRSPYEFNEDHIPGAINLPVLDDEERKKIEDSKKKIEWGSQIRNYVLHPYKIIKDVRTGHESGNTEAVLNGELNNFLKSFLLKGS